MGPVRRMRFPEVDFAAGVLLTDPGTQAGNGGCRWEGKTRAKGEVGKAQGQQDSLRGSAEYIQSDPMAFRIVPVRTETASFFLSAAIMSSGYLALN